MKVGIVYTSTTPELIEILEKEIKQQLSEEVEILNYEDGSILVETREHGFVTKNAACRLIELFLKAAQNGAEAILNVCSSVGEVADCVQDMAKYIGVPIVRIDEEMCRDAVRHGKRIGILATLPTTLIPTKNTILRVAREMGKEVILVESLVEAFGADQDEFKKLLLDKAKEIKEKVDVILLCQGSMAYVENLIEKECEKMTVSSPRYGAKELRSVLVKKGIIKE